jgi:hypothetical protein
MLKLALSVLVFLTLVATKPEPTTAQTVNLVEATSTNTSRESPQVVELGIYPLSINDLDMRRNSYFLDFYIWIKWTGALDPLKTMRFVNMVDEWSSKTERATTEHTLLEDGTKYQIMRVEGRFVEPFDFRRFPFDEQKLEIVIEDEEHSENELSYVIDRDNSKVDKSLHIPGWEIRDVYSTTVTREYESNFGIHNLNTNYSSARFSVVIARPASVFYWKLMTPLAIVLLACLSSLLLPSRQIDSRITLVASGLLTAVFLQRLYQENLPDISYLVVMDKVYILAYIVIFICLLRVVYTFLGTRHEDDTTCKRYRYADMMVIAGLLAFFFLFTTGLVLTA